MNARNSLKSNKAHLAVEPLENRLAPAIYMKFDSVPGESMQRPESHIELMSFSLGIVQTQSQNGGAGRSSSMSLLDFSIVRKQDQASPDLFLNCCTGKHLPEVVLTTPGGDAQQPYFKYEFEQVYISSVRPGGGGGGSEFPLEEVSFNFTKIDFDYKPEVPGKQQSYLKFELENTLISGYSSSSSGSDRPMESLSLNFTKINYDVMPETGTDKSNSNLELPRNEQEKPKPPKDDKGSRASQKSDFTGDGKADVLAVWNPWDVNPGSLPPGVGPLTSFNGFAGGVRVSVGDVNADGFDDIITGNAVDNDDAEIVVCMPELPLSNQRYMPSGSALWAKHSEDTPGLQADLAGGVTLPPLNARGFFDGLISDEYFK